MEYYNVFYTDKPLAADIKPDFSMLMPLNFASKDEALKEAFKLIYSGAVVWKIEGPEGFILDQAEIKDLYLKFQST